MAQTKLGGTIGSLTGFLIGSFIPSEGEIALSFFQRITGWATASVYDFQGFIVSCVYVIIAIVIFGFIGTIIGSLIE